MQDFFETVGHAMWTTISVCLANWTAVGTGILMALQATVLIYKLVDRRKKNA